MKKNVVKKIFLFTLVISMLTYSALTFSLNIRVNKSDYFSHASSNGAKIDPEIETFIQNGADEYINYYISQANTQLAVKNPYVLYDIQINTNNLLDYASLTSNYPLLDKLGSLYLITYPYLEMQDGYLKWICGTPSCPAWSDTDTRANNKETILTNSQFLYLLSDYIGIVAGIDPSARTDNMREMITKFVPIIADDHLNRWVLGTDQNKLFTAWADCTTGDNGVYRGLPYNHQELLYKKLNRGVELGSGKSYCHAVTDSDLWIISSTAKILNANAKDPTFVPISDSLKASLIGYLRIGSSLIEDRTAISNYDDPVRGNLSLSNFDLGSWDDHPEYSYSGYSASEFPGISSTQLVALPQEPADNVGADLSHGRRIVNTYDALLETKPLIGSSFPSTQVMQGLTNQLISKVYNQSESGPLFSNYLDGTNGWYRVNYSGRNGFGYAPFSLSSSVLTGGYGFWSRYNGDINNVMAGIWQKIKSNMIIDQSQNKNLGLNNGVTFESGKLGNSIYFDGNSAHYVEPCIRQPFKSAKSTIEFWIKPDGDGDMDLVDLTQDGYTSLMLIRKTVNNSIVIYSEENNVAKLSLTSQPINNPTAWHHVAVTQDGSGVKIYIDGTLDTNTTGVNQNTWTENLNFNSVWIGKGHWSAFRGSMDDFRVYDSALSASEINKDINGEYNTGNNLKIAWNFDQSPSPESSSFIKKYYNLGLDGLMNFLPSMALNLSVKDDVAITPEKKFIYPGGTLRYNISYTNNSGGAITNFKIEDQIPSSAYYVENTATNSARYENGKLIWEQASLEANQSFTASFSLRMF